MSSIKKLGNEIGIKWTNYLDAKFIKSKDFVTFLKSKVFVLFNNHMMKNNVTLFTQVEMMSEQAPKKKSKEESPQKQLSPEKQSKELSSVIQNNNQWLNQV